MTKNAFGLASEDCEGLTCQNGIANLLAPVSDRDAMRSRFVTASQTKDRNSSQTVMTSQAGESSRSQFVILSLPQARRGHPRSRVSSNPKREFLTQRVMNQGAEL